MPDSHISNPAFQKPAEEEFPQASCWRDLLAGEKSHDYANFR